MNQIIIESVYNSKEINDNIFPIFENYNKINCKVYQLGLIIKYEDELYCITPFKLHLLYVKSYIIENNYKILLNLYNYSYILKLCVFTINTKKEWINKYIINKLNYKLDNKYFYIFNNKIHKINIETLYYSPDYIDKYKLIYYI